MSIVLLYSDMQKTIGSEPDPVNRTGYHENKPLCAEAKKFYSISVYADYNRFETCSQEFYFHK